MNAPDRAARSPRRLLPHAVVFLSSMGVMVIELAASRIVSKYLGSSLYTWTGVIGIVLGGISLGNWLGGKLSDRFPPRKLVPLLLLASSLLTFLIVVLDLLVGVVTAQPGFQALSLGVLVRSLLLILVLFFLPACALGTISPAMAKRALEGTAGVGRTVGGLYAAGSLGSIAGTFLSGYLLIPLLGITNIILLVGALLGLLSLAMGGRRIVAGAWVLVLGVLFVTRGAEAAQRKADGRSAEGRTVLFRKDSPYSWIKVAESSAGGAPERTLRLDALIHNRHDPADPDNLLYEYERMFAALTTDAAARLGRAPATFTIGGGAFTFPSWLARHFPAGAHEVAEIDPDVVETAHRFFDFPRGTAVRVRVEDARTCVDSLRGRRFDLVYGDAFNAFSVPYHLTTREFAAKVKGVLAPGGTYLTNVIDILDAGAFLNAYVNTMSAVFPHAAVYAAMGSEAGQRNTFVVAAGERDAWPAVLRDRDGKDFARRLDESVLAGLRARHGDRPLTDDYAPVETLMAPVFLGAVK